MGSKPNVPSLSNEKWFEEWFDRDEYKLVYQHRDGDEADRVVSLIESLAAPDPGSKILDVGCGRGRHAIRLAARGFEVTGLDLSMRSIEEAKTAAERAGKRVQFEVADMRNPFCNGCFDGVVNLFTAFGYFRHMIDHQRALTAMATAIRPGGWFVQDFLNADYVSEHLVPHDTRTTNGMRIDQRRWIENGRINKRIEIVDVKTRKESAFDESVQLFDVSSLERLHRHAGLEVERIVGDYDGGPLTPCSPRLIMLSRRSPQDGDSAGTPQ